MLTAVALIAAPSYMVHGPGHNFAGAWEFVAVVLVLIAAIFVRVYVLGDWFRRRAAHRSGQRGVHRPASKRRTNRP
jgi:hypothetical protein